MNRTKRISCQSDKEWQVQFANMKSYILPANEDPYSLFGTVSGYAAFLDGVLYTIRHGEVDYCYSIEHIADLLRFENETLCSRWLPKEGYFRVWLEF